MALFALCHQMALESLFSVAKMAAGGQVFQARDLDDVEVDVSHDLCCWGVGRFEAVEEHVVASAVRLAVERVVGEVVAAREGAHLGGAEVVGAAAAVQPPVRAQVVVIRGDVASTAPFCAWNEGKG